MTNTKSLSARIASTHSNIPNRDNRILENSERTKTLYRYLGIIEQVAAVEIVETPLSSYSNPAVERGQYVLLVEQATSAENGIYEYTDTGLVPVIRPYDVGNLVDDISQNNETISHLWKLESLGTNGEQSWIKEEYYDSPPSAA